MQYATLCFERTDGSRGVIKVSQGENIATHIYTLNNDYNGADTGKDWLLAPFDCIVKAIRTFDNQILFANIEPVMTPSGVQEHVCFTPTHMDDVDFKQLGIVVGKRFKQGERIYREGTKGIGSGNHIHMSQAFGAFKGGTPTVKMGKTYKYSGKTYEQYKINADNEVSAYDAFFVGCPVVKGLSDTANKYVWQQVPKESEGNGMEFIDGYQEYAWQGQRICLYKQKDDEEIGMISATGDPDYKAVQLIKDIDDSRTHMCKVNANYFEMQNASEYGQHYGVEISPQLELAPKQKEWLAFWVDKNNVAHVCDSDEFWLGSKDVKFACSPAAVMLLDGEYRDLYSPAAGWSKVTTANTQTLLLQCADGKYALAIVTGKLDLYQCRNFAKAYGCTLMAAMDSGGSTQMRANGKPVLETGRKIPNVLTIYKKVEEALPEPITPPTEGSEPEPETPKPSEPTEPETPEETTPEGTEDEVYKNIGKQLIELVLSVVKYVLKKLFRKEREEN